MKSFVKLFVLCALASPAWAQVSLNGVRVGASDPAAVAKFYQQAFGMQEVQRIENPQMLEIMLNFGKTPAAAKALRERNQGGDIVILKRASDAVKDDATHIVLNVANMAAVVTALKAAGGKMEREPFEFGKSGIFIGMAMDPAGNHIELIQGASGPAAAK